MIINQDIQIEKGRTGTIVVAVKGFTSFDDMIVKLYATYRIGKDIIIELTGVINSIKEEITFDYTQDTTKDIKWPKLFYEIVLFKADKSYVKNISSGRLFIRKSIKDNPTV